MTSITDRVGRKIPDLDVAIGAARLVRGVVDRRAVGEVHGVALIANQRIHRHVGVILESTVGRGVPIALSVPGIMQAFDDLGIRSKQEKRRQRQNCRHQGH